MEHFGYGYDKSGVALEPVETGGAIVQVAGPTASDKAIRIPKRSYLRCKHGLTPDDGYSKVNRYTMQFDLKISSLSQYYSFIDIGDGLGTPTREADIYINADGFVGNATLGFGTALKLPLDTWVTISFSVDLLEKVFTYYINGYKIRTATLTDISAIPDGRWALMPEGCLLFADYAGNDAELDVANVRFLAEALNDEEIGKTGPQLIPKTGLIVTQSSYQATDGGPGTRAFDNNKTTFWHSQYSPLISYPHWLIAQFPIAIELMILEHTTRPAASWSDCYDFELSGSNDGVNWTSLLDYRVWQQGDNTVFIDSKGQAYKYFRWYMPRMGSGRGQFAGIAELTMYGYIR